MLTTRFRRLKLTFVVLTLIAAGLACQAPGIQNTPTLEIPPTATQRVDPTPTNTPFPPIPEESGGEPNLVITNVTLDTTTPPAGGWVLVDVTEGGRLSVNVCPTS